MYINIYYLFISLLACLFVYLNKDVLSKLLLTSNSVFEIFYLKAKPTKQTKQQKQKQTTPPKENNRKTKQSKKTTTQINKQNNNNNNNKNPNQMGDRPDER